MFGQLRTLRSSPGLNHNVGGRNELAEQPAAVKLPQIDSHRPLVGIEVPESQRCLASRLAIPEGSAGTGGLATRRFDLDHVRAKVGKKFAAVMPHLSGEVEDANAVECCVGHVGSLKPKLNFRFQPRIFFFPRKKTRLRRSPVFCGVSRWSGRENVSAFFRFFQVSSGLSGPLAGKPRPQHEPNPRLIHYRS